jgi:hypothetical protein
MKKLFSLLLVGLTLCATPALAKEKPTHPIAMTDTDPGTDEAAAAHAQALIKRLEEIKAMDKSDMTRAEKRSLRKEVKDIRAELRSTSNGIYLSIGAIIIIILLLILLL